MIKNLKMKTALTSVITILTILSIVITLVKAVRYDISDENIGAK